MTPEYLAGLFDGEGCIDVQRMYPQTHRSKLYVRPRVRMCMADNARELGQRLRAKFGGHMSSRKAGTRNQQGSWSLEWLSGKEIRRILNLLLPHLIVKAEQAKLALWWLDNMTGRQSTYFAGIDQARAAFAEEMHAMKVDPQRLSERATKRIALLMRQSDLHGDMERTGEIAVPLAV